ncbi:MAG: lysoplasmalogenase [Oscillospiraceae bacterium]
MQYTVIVFCAVIAVSYLIVCWQRKVNLMRMLKCLLVPSIAIVYFYFTKEINWLIAAGAAFGLIGDYLLLIKKLVPGGISFFLGHVMYSIAFAQNTKFALGTLLWGAALCAVYALTSTCVIKNVIKGKRLAKKMRVTAFLYIMSVGLMSAFALMQFVSVPSAQFAVIYFGSLLFLISDCLILFEKFAKSNKPNHRHFVVMVTYIAAQMMIILGMIN